MNINVSDTVIEHGAVLMIPLNKLKTSPKNARKTRHDPADIETLAASIAEKGVLQPLVVEPDIQPDGVWSGFYFVTIGEGRRQAQQLRAARKEIKKTEPIRCIVDLKNDPHEISLDENVTRFAMHPADEFEAFHRLATERGYGAEEIGARFGKPANIVRQRLKLAAVSPALLQTYRAGGLTLEQLMALTLTGDHARQIEVLERLGQNAQPSAIRRLLTEDKVHASDRRAVFVGAEAYEAAGGVIDRDLFSEDRGGYFTDPALLDRLALQKLQVLAQAQTAEGWRWAEAALDYPHANGLKRLYPGFVGLSEADQQRLDELEAAFEAVQAEYGEEEDDVPDEILERVETLTAEIDSLNRQRYAYDPADIARSGVFVILGRDGQPRVECGSIRPDDGAGEAGENKSAEASGGPNGAEVDPNPTGATQKRPPLSDRLVADLTAHRTAALQNALAQKPEVALVALLHALVSKVFAIGVGAGGGLLCIKAGIVDLGGQASELWDSRLGVEIAARQAAWAERLPDASDALWAAIEALDHQEQLALLAHCVSRTVDAVELGGRRPVVQTKAEDLARKLDLDMTDYWTATAASYLGHIPKASILEAVRDAVSPRAAHKIEPLKKPEMAKAAEQLLAGTGWLPPILRLPDTDTLSAQDNAPALAAE